MERTTRQSWLAHINAWKESGLSQAEFCRREGLRYPKFCYHCQQDRHNRKAKKSVSAECITKKSIKSIGGRKNWLFSGSPRGAESSAMLYSLIETAKANKINPQTYLLHVFEKIPYADTKEKLQELLPWNCKDDLNVYA